MKNSFFPKKRGFILTKFLGILTFIKMSFFKFFFLLFYVFQHIFKCLVFIYIFYLTKSSSGNETMRSIWTLYGGFKREFTFENKYISVKILGILEKFFNSKNYFGTLLNTFHLDDMFPQKQRKDNFHSIFTLPEVLLNTFWRAFFRLEPLF